MTDVDRLASLLGHLYPLYPLYPLPSRAHAREAQRPSGSTSTRTTRETIPSPRRNGVVVLACSERDIMADGGAA